MKKIFIIIFYGAILFILGVNSDSVFAQNGEVDDWKEFELKLCQNKSNPKKILTPEQLQDKDKHYNAPASYGTYLTGVLENNTGIAIIDFNKNNKFDDIGEDVVVFGNSLYGLPLSKIINIKNKLYCFKLDTVNYKAFLKPYDGDTGRVDMVSKYKSIVPLDLIILSSGNGDYFDVARNKSYLLPCGTYSLYLAYIVNGKSMHAVIRNGNMSKIEVKKSDTDNDIAVVSWGGPLRLDYAYTFFIPPELDRKNNGTNKKVSNSSSNGKLLPWYLGIKYSSLKVTGSANEEYINFSPFLTSAVEVKDIRGKNAFPSANCGLKVTPGDPGS